MTPRDTMDRGTRTGHPTCSIATMTLAALVLIFTALPTALHADDFTTLYANQSWQQKWGDTFEHSINDDWTVIRKGRGDLKIVPDGHTDIKRSACDPPSNVLYGKSPYPEPGNGFSASSPALEDLGINADIDTYRISFRYKILGPNPDLCWSIPLASPDATLVVTECVANGTRAVLGTVDHAFKNFRELTEIPTEEWVDFSVVVKPVAATGERQVRVFVNGMLVDEYVRTTRSSHRAIAFIDLPAFPVDAAADYADFQLPPNVFSEVYWDDVSLSVIRSDGSARGKRHVTIDPNPFNPSTSVCMELEEATWLDVTIFDVRGRRVRGVHAGVLPAGPVRLHWNGQDDRGRMVSSGVYYVRTSLPGDTRITRAVLVR